MDQNGSRAVHADAGQIVLTGWINAPSSTVVGMLLEIDGDEPLEYIALILYS